MGLADRAYMYEPRAPEPGRRGRSAVKGAREASDPRIMTVMLSVIGTGYLGATHAVCMAELGFEVIEHSAQRGFHELDFLLRHRYADCPITK